MTDRTDKTSPISDELDAAQGGVIAAILLTLRDELDLDEVPDPRALDAEGVRDLCVILMDRHAGLVAQVERLLSLIGDMAGALDATVEKVEAVHGILQLAAAQQAEREAGG